MKSKQLSSSSRCASFRMTCCALYGMYMGYKEGSSAGFPEFETFAVPTCHISLNVATPGLSDTYLSPHPHLLLS